MTKRLKGVDDSLNDHAGLWSHDGELRNIRRRATSGGSPIGASSRTSPNKSPKVGAVAPVLRASFRFIGLQTSRIRRIFGLLPAALALGGGGCRTARKVILVLLGEGVSGLRSRMLFLENMRESPATARRAKATREPRAYSSLIVPHYIDPRLDSQPPQCPKDVSIAVHLYLLEANMLKEITDRLANIPCCFDLYVSIPIGTPHEHVANLLRSRLPRLGKLAVDQVPGRGQGLGSLVLHFGKCLMDYEIIGHFHTIGSCHTGHVADRHESALDDLLGTARSTGGRIAYLFALLQSRAKLIYPERSTKLIDGALGEVDDPQILHDILKGHTNLSIDDIRNVEYPESGMFWTRGACLRKFLELPSDFHELLDQSIKLDGMPSSALERLILPFSQASEGQILRLHRGDSVIDFCTYESRQDFSTSIIHHDVKILAYYLPQFHPIPENDEWHGKGFTEWTKVRAANPLFQGHYQQHIPHPDIGYYVLDNPETLRMQADVMRTAGVHGMVFYHYWFGGKMILERPARMLLETPDITMPYCFCWANENWTRRWDGDESDVLLAQAYSAQDAHAFIRHLIPFFRDPRHIRIDGRPVLFVYRPSSIPDTTLYVDAWAEECQAAGLKEPYLVAVLTRGATHPHQVNMDAGVERVLHDWTDGGASEIKETLESYVPINGRVLSYGDVARFYSEQEDAKDFTYFRSLVPIWDNTARYGSEAFVVHGSTPGRFQEWLESSIRYSKRNLPADRRFVLVNAWNEWAEGAHLEPDARFGYAYLNAVGRALSAIPVSHQLNPDDIEIDGTRIHLVFPPHFIKFLAGNTVQAKRVLQVFARSSIFGRCPVTIAAELVDQFPLTVTAGKPLDAEFIIEFRKPAFFGPRNIEKMVQLALAQREAPAVIIPNVYGDTADGSLQPADFYQPPLVLYPASTADTASHRICMRPDAHCFLTEVHTEPQHKLPVVTTIIRVHKHANFELLRNALCSLAAMRNCITVPLIAAQDLSHEQTHALTSMLDDIPWYPGHAPTVDFYHSVDGCGDLRSRMLNKSLLKVETQYAGFLDYDDLLMPHAYAWLIDRLRTTGKAVTFGRVFLTAFSHSSGLWLERSRAYEDVRSYEDFIGDKNVPLHSFLLDMTAIDATKIIYHDDHRYMEDYFLNLQIFTEDNCDWDGLMENRYIGDYIHGVDRPHTLALMNDTEREALLGDPEYRLCETRVNDLRQRLIQQRAVAIGSKKAPCPTPAQDAPTSMWKHMRGFPLEWAGRRLAVTALRGLLRPIARPILWRIGRYFAPRAEYNEALLAINNNIYVLEETLSAVNDRNHALTKQNDALNKQADRLTEQISVLSGQIELLNQKMAPMEHALGFGQQALHDVSRALFSSRETVPAIQGQTVGVIVTTCDRPLQLERALFSLSCQTRPPDTVMLINDGRNAVRTIVERFSERLNISLLNTDQPYSGPSAARNVALNALNSDFVAFLDDDNLMWPRWIERALCLFEADSKLDLVYGAQLRDAEMSTTDKKWFLVPFDLEKLRQDNFIDLNQVIHRASTLRFDETLKRMVDWDYFLRFAEHSPGGIKAVNAISSVYSTFGWNRITVPGWPPDLGEIIARSRHLGAPSLPVEVRACCCCGYVGEFERGPGGRPRAGCLRCGSLERHRFLHLMAPFLRRFWIPETRGQAETTLMEIAPSLATSEFRQMFGTALTIDANPTVGGRAVKIVGSLTNLPLADGAVDIALGLHVLEHIPADRVAMSEIARVLAPNGLAVLQVPLSGCPMTDEEVIECPEVRKVRYDQLDYVRVYGDDFFLRLESAGLKSISVSPRQSMLPESIEKHGLLPDEALVFSVRSNSPSALGRLSAFGSMLGRSCISASAMPEEAASSASGSR